MKIEDRLRAECQRLVGHDDGELCLLHEAAARLGAGEKLLRLFTRKGKFHMRQWPDDKEMLHGLTEATTILADGDEDRTAPGDAPGSGVTRPTTSPSRPPECAEDLRCQETCRESPHEICSGGSLPMCGDFPDCHAAPPVLADVRCRVCGEPASCPRGHREGLMDIGEPAIEHTDCPTEAELAEMEKETAAPFSVEEARVGYIWDDCDQDAIYCEDHAAEMADFRDDVQNSPTGLREQIAGLRRERDDAINALDENWVTHQELLELRAKLGRREASLRYIAEVAGVAVVESDSNWAHHVRVGVVKEIERLKAEARVTLTPTDEGSEK